ncbi:unnamed protein product, partial [Didymodactylos carnosus]
HVMASNTCTVLNTNAIQNDDTTHQNQHQNDNEQNDNEDAIDNQHNNNDSIDDATDVKLSETSDDDSASGSNSSDKPDDEEMDKVHKKRTSRRDHSPNKKEVQRILDLIEPILNKSKPLKIKALTRPHLDFELKEMFSKFAVVTKTDEDFKSVQERILTVVRPLTNLWSKILKVKKRKKALKLEKIEPLLQQTALLFGQTYPPKQPHTDGNERYEDINTLKLKTLPEFE